MIRHSITLAAIAGATIGAGYALVPTSPPIVAKAVVSEGYTARRMDDATFRARYLPVADLPPMREVVHEPLLLVSHEPPMRERSIDEGTADRRHLVVRAAASRPASHRAGLCARHGMRKVSYGRTWRCRR